MPLTNLSVPIFQIWVASYELDSFTSPSIWYEILLLCTYRYLLQTIVHEPKT
nr:hypothetical protein Iba_scaffold33770CG0340 [Ipomoea batatas]GMD08677.1 hypothetical protein Iba_chr06dCG0800 [Ipomoea batatas]GMD27390.1 hypothetical protein Iba_chr08dCG13310 [Ipomoea batatas]GMD27798.1 hypothetical protein Iba_chr08eCG1320 [Ipomoea batatas]GMD57875.1 hypothetical protein Iba_chr11fCG0130 [Ipomoea batatas]